MPSTISSSSRTPSPGPESAPRKRPRVDDELEQVLAELQPCGGDLIRDDTYYMSDGSCVLQVENTLFNVHRTILSKDSSSFSSMFQLPQGDHEEGRSDDNPIVLCGDTVDEFKHFLWALYALPHELMAIVYTNPDMGHLVDIARVANKYSFRSVETWALDGINELVNRKPSPVIMPVGFGTPLVAVKAAIASNSALISRLMRLAQMCGHERLLHTMVTTLGALMTTSIHYAQLAMTLADDLDLRTLRGAAYLEVMQKEFVTQHAGAPPADFASVDTLIDGQGRLFVSHEQQLRLLLGYYRLTAAWERLRAKPLHFDHATTCGPTWNQHGCTQSWLEFWKEKTKSDTVLALSVADVTGRLRAVQKEFDRWGSATYMHHDCRVSARKAIVEKIKQVEEILPDYFVMDSAC